MDWITLLRSLQSDFIKRLSSGCLLHCEIEGQYSELTIISGERLKILRDFCWQIEDYTQAIKINPQYADIYKNRGIFRYLLGTQTGFTQAIKINPNDANAYKNRGDARADIGDYMGAIEDYTQAIQINPHAADAYYNRGNARYDLGDEAGAIEDYTQAIQMNPTYADAYYNRGNVRAEIKEKQAAIADFQKAADIYHKEGKLEALKDTRERILELEIEESIDILNF